MKKQFCLTGQMKCKFWLVCENFRPRDACKRFRKRDADDRRRIQDYLFPRDRGDRN